MVPSSTLTLQMENTIFWIFRNPIYILNYFKNSFYQNLVAFSCLTVFCFENECELFYLISLFSWHVCNFWSLSATIEAGGSNSWTVCSDIIQVIHSSYRQNRESPPEYMQVTEETNWYLKVPCVILWPKTCCDQKMAAVLTCLCCVQSRVAFCCDALFFFFSKISLTPLSTNVCVLNR